MRSSMDSHPGRPALMLEQRVSHVVHKHFMLPRRHAGNSGLRLPFAMLQTFFVRAPAAWHQAVFNAAEIKRQQGIPAVH